MQRAAALGALAVAQAWALALAISRLWAGGALASSLVPATVFLACYVLRQATRTLQDSRMERYAGERAGELRRNLLERIYDEGPALVQKTGSGGISALALEGISQVETYLELILPKMVGVVAIPVVILIAIFATDWTSGIIALACYPITVLYMVMLGKTAQERAAAAEEAEGRDGSQRGGEGDGKAHERRMARRRAMRSSCAFPTTSSTRCEASRPCASSAAAARTPAASIR